jgi:hypothetical protein
VADGQRSRQQTQTDDEHGLLYEGTLLLLLLKTSKKSRFFSSNELRHAWTIVEDKSRTIELSCRKSHAVWPGTECHRYHHNAVWLLVQ